MKRTQPQRAFALLRLFLCRSRGPCFFDKGAGRTRYIKAEKVPPDELLCAVQIYIDDEYLYISRRKCNRRAWGEKNGYKNSLQERDREICKRYLTGADICELAHEYFLSEQSIRRIFRRQKETV